MPSQPPLIPNIPFCWPSTLNLLVERCSISIWTRISCRFPCLATSDMEMRIFQETIPNKLAIASIKDYTILKGKAVELWNFGSASPASALGPGSTTSPTPLSTAAGRDPGTGLWCSHPVSLVTWWHPLTYDLHAFKISNSVLFFRVQQGTVFKWNM